METNKRTIEKVLEQALELYAKGVSLHSIVRTYPEYKNEIEEMFGAIAILSNKEHIEVPETGLQRILNALPEENETPAKREASLHYSPFATLWDTLRTSNWKYALPIALVALLTGSAIVTRHSSLPQLASLPAGEQQLGTTPSMSAPGAPLATNNPSAQSTGATMKTAAPMAMTAPLNPTDRMVASFTQEAATETTIASTTSGEKTIALGDAAFMSDPTAGFGKQF